MLKILYEERERCFVIQYIRKISVQFDTTTVVVD
jgi:hypothetical protein